MAHAVTANDLVKVGSVDVGKTQSSAITITFTSNTTLSSLKVVTQGIENADYKDGGTGTCKAGQTYAANSGCILSLSFSPLKVGLRTGAIVATGSDGKKTVVYLSGFGQGGTPVFQPGMFSYIAGYPSGTPGVGRGDSGDGGPALGAKFNFPGRLSVDAVGNTYIVDQGNHRIRKVDTKGVVNTVAGNGQVGYTGDNGKATDATLSDEIGGLAIDSVGNLYIADGGNHVIRKVDIDGIISTFAGTGVRSVDDKSAPTTYGDDGPATSALLNYPKEIAAAPDGTVFFSDYGNSRIRKITTDGLIHAYAGKPGCVDATGDLTVEGDGGPALQGCFWLPEGLTLDAEGNLYFTDFTNYVWLVDATSPNNLHRFAGTGKSGYSGDGGYASAATLNNPASLAADASGNIYIADSGNNVIRKINSLRLISTVAGSGNLYSNADQGIPATSANIFEPETVATDGDGNIYTADADLSTIIKIAANTAILPSDAQSQPINIVNIGNAPFTFDSFSGSNAKISIIDGHCKEGGSVTVAGSCSFNVTAQGVGNISVVSSITQDQKTTQTVLLQNGPPAYKLDHYLITGPTTTSPDASVSYRLSVSDANGSSISDYQGTALISSTDSGAILPPTATFSSASTTIPVTFHTLGNQTLTITDTLTKKTSSITVSVTDLTPTTLALTSSSASGHYGDTITLTATLSPYKNETASTDGGTITLLTGNEPLVSSPIKDGKVILSTSSLPRGTNSITASFTPSNSDKTFAPSTSSPISVQINGIEPTLALTSSASKATVGQPVTFTATLNPAVAGDKTTDGETVTFNSAVATLGAAKLSGGVATFTTSTIPVGSTSVSAQYSPSSTNEIFAPATASPVAITVEKVTPTLNLTASAAKVTVGQPITFTATLNPASAAGAKTDGETVTFSSTQAALGTAKLSGGVATFTTSTIPVGSISVVAQFSPASTIGVYNAAISTQTSVTVVEDTTPTPTKIVPTVKLTASNATPYFGQDLTLTATISSSNGTPTGSIAFMDGTTLLGSSAIANGTATLTNSTLSIGKHTITALFAGDNTFDTATSPAATITVATPLLVFNDKAETLFLGEVTVKPGVQGTLNFRLSSLGTLAGTLSVACTGLPEGYTCTPSPSVVDATKLPSNVVVTIAGKSSKTSTASNNLFSSSHLTLASLLLLPAMWKKRRKLSSYFCLLFVLALTFGLSGCGDSGKKAYTGTINITAANTLIGTATFTVIEKQ